MLPMAAQAEQMPGFILSFCGSAITIQLDRDVNVSFRRGTVFTLKVTPETAIEGPRNGQNATVDFNLADKVARHIWFQGAGIYAPHYRDDNVCSAQGQPGQSTAKTSPPVNGSKASTTPERAMCEGADPKLMIQRAQSGDAAGEFCWAIYSINGAYGVAKNPGQGLSLLQRSAERGYAHAETLLGDFYRSGNGVPQNGKQAEYWLLKAAHQGDPAGETELADLYAEGAPDLPADKAKARQWAELASRQNYSPAFNMLAKLNGPTQHGSEPAQDVYAQASKLYQAGKRAESASYFLQAAKAGNSKAQLQIGWHYENGVGVTRNYAEAARWYRAAADNGNAIAMKNLGQLYELGAGVPEDWLEAARWYQKSASLADRDGESALARAYEFGIGVPQSRDLAIQWDQRAAAQGDGKAAYFAEWLRDRTNNIGFRNQYEKDLVMAGRLRFGGVLAGGDPAGITFANSNERAAWLLRQRKTLDYQEAWAMYMIRSSQFQQCRSSGRGFCQSPGPPPQR